jgi:hypothetical protein
MAAVFGHRLLAPRLSRAILIGWADDRGVRPRLCADSLLLRDPRLGLAGGTRQRLDAPCADTRAGPL